MIDLLKTYARFVVRHAWLVLVVSLVLSGILAAGVTKLQIEVDPEKQMPADHPFIMIDKKIRKEFGG